MEFEIKETDDVYPCNGKIFNHKNFCMFCWKDTKNLISHMNKKSHRDNYNKYNNRDITKGTVKINCPICLQLHINLHTEKNEPINERE